MPDMNDARLTHLVRFYSIIGTLESNIGGAKRLSDCSGGVSWPKRGVYFFCEAGDKTQYIRFMACPQEYNLIY
jgi:hypothetical protein